jgi:hypothetical protein
MRLIRIAAVVMAGLLPVCFAQSNSKDLKITNAPVIESVTNHSATIAWSTNTGGSSVVKYGTDPNNLSKTEQEPYKQGGGTHRVKLENLQPNTKYYFTVSSAHGQGTGTSASATDDLKTLPGPGTALPLYRAVSASGTHLFTHDFQELKNAVGQGFKREGIAAWISKDASNGAVPLYRLFNPQTGDHLYTTKTDERDAAAKQGYTAEGEVGYVLPSQSNGAVPLYRLLSPQGVHFYTTNQDEKSTLTSQGYKDEGITGYVWSE